MTEHDFTFSQIRRDDLNDNDDMLDMELVYLEQMLPTPSLLSGMLPEERLEQALPMLDLDSEDVWQDLRGLTECCVICGEAEKLVQIFEFLEAEGQIGMLYGQHQLEKALGISSTAGWLGDYAIQNEDLPMLELLYERGLLVLDYGRSASVTAMSSDGMAMNFSEPHLHYVARVGQPKIVAWMLTKPESDITAKNQNGETIETACKEAIKRLQVKYKQLRDLWSELDDYSEKRRCGEELILTRRRIEGVKESIKLIRASA